RRVVATNREQSGHVESEQRDHDVFEVSRIPGRIRARDPDVRAAAKVDAADRVDREGRDVFDVTVHQPLESVAHADHVHAVERGADGRRANHAVDAGCGSAADKDGEFLVTFHARTSYSGYSHASIDHGMTSVERRTLGSPGWTRAPAERRHVPSNATDRRLHLRIRQRLPMGLTER